jgi:hypothetical protein
MLAVSCSSGSRFVCHLAKPAITSDMHSRIRPAPRPGADNDSVDADEMLMRLDADEMTRTKMILMKSAALLPTIPAKSGLPQPEE